MAEFTYDVLRMSTMTFVDLWYDRYDGYDRSQERADAVIVLVFLGLGGPPVKEKLVSASAYLGPVVPVVPDEALDKRPTLFDHRHR